MLVSHASSSLPGRYQHLLQYMTIANTGIRVKLLPEIVFVASFRNSGARIREPRDRNMKENETNTRRRSPHVLGQKSVQMRCDDTVSKVPPPYHRTASWQTYTGSAAHAAPISWRPGWAAGPPGRPRAAPSAVGSSRSSRAASWQLVGNGHQRLKLPSFRPHVAWPIRGPLGPPSRLSQHQRPATKDRYYFPSMLVLSITSFALASTTCAARDAVALDAEEARNDTGLSGRSKMLRVCDCAAAMLRGAHVAIVLCSFYELALTTVCAVTDAG